MRKTFMIGWLSALLLLAGGLVGCGETEKEVEQWSTSRRVTVGSGGEDDI